ncbi:MAG: hypothetical protein JNIBNLAF_00590 [Nitrosomonas europaea]|nr:MAG: hypothetical protein UZ02_AOB001001373 [Nitrosomonas europaea]MBV6388994.1 hypothetical protein [Nitrosomonas europaea]
MARRKKKTTRLSAPTNTARPSRLWHTFQWFSVTGFLVAAFTVTYQHFFGNISLEFVRSLARGYEFQLKNDTPSDRLVKMFRVEPPTNQEVLYKTTQSIYAEVTETGRIILPSSNISYVPAAEFKELDGQRLPANSSSKFRIPPLSSNSWMEPEAAIVDIRYEIEPTNSLLLALELILNAVGVREAERSERYVVINNYWVASQSEPLREAIRIACRDEGSLAKSSVCAAKR